MGFLPKNNIQRMRLIFEISKNEKTTVLYEAPHSLNPLN